jgi:CheY-like chemotaxis protein
MKKKIMVVDDEPDIAYTVKSNLTLFDSDYEVTCADSGEKCLELLKNNEIPDLILLDIMMPAMDGWEVFDKIQKNPSWKNIRIIFVTGTDVVADNAKTILNEDYFIEKPYKPAELKEKIAKVLCSK